MSKTDWLPSCSLVCIYTVNISRAGIITQTTAILPLPFSFLDIRDFTQTAESLEVGKLISIMSDYLEEMSAIIMSCGGTVSDFIGDGILVLYTMIDCRLNLRGDILLLPF